MKRFFYPTLAWQNLCRNKSIYLPYLLAGAIIVSLFYSLGSMVQMIMNSDGSATMALMLNISRWVCGIISLPVLFYINSFVVKCRRREFGLYSILGMEKRHIAHVMLWEVLYTSVVSIAGGVLGGALFSQLLFLLLQRMASMPVELTFAIPLSAVGSTLLVYALAFLIVYLYDVAGIARSQAVELLQSKSAGEREPRSRWAFALLGTVALCVGYGLAVTVKNGSDALTCFLPAVLLVICATYLLFTAGSIVVLKLLRRNRRFYYRPQNFISVSGMLYRMKQNAVGLANICILSTCVLVTLSSTVSLFIGQEDIINRRYPREIMLSTPARTEADLQTLEQYSEEFIGRFAAQPGLQRINPVSFNRFRLPVSQQGDRFVPARHYGGENYGLEMMTLADYNRIVGIHLTLDAGEVFVAVTAGASLGDTFTIGERSYRIAGEVDRVDVVAEGGAGLELLVVVPSFDDLLDLRDLANATYTEGQRWYVDANVLFDLPDTLTSQQKTDFSNQMIDSLRKLDHPLLLQLETLLIDSRSTARTSFFELYGTLFFVGIFFIALFLLATVLIIYYKQITEGYEDRDRFRIMQNVGLSDAEVRSTIRRQVLMVFFLPLGMAGLHIAAAFPALCKLLQGFNLYNVPLFFFCTLGALAAFVLFYLATYILTARTYYRIVSG